MLISLSLIIKQDKRKATMTSNIFKDLQIIELASVLAGPSVGMFFAELGAKVVKYENALTKGDVTRSWKTTHEKTKNTSAYFASINYGKEHILVDYNNSTELELVKESIKQADIVICNFKEGLAEKYKLDFASLQLLNKQIIYAQLDGFDQDTHRVAFDVVLQAECGYMFMNGEPETPPTKMPLAFMDILAAHQLKEGILVALIERYKYGKGSLVNCSLEKSAIASLANQASNYLMSSFIPQRMGSLHPNIAPYGEQFITKDDKSIVLAVGSDKQFEKLCDILKINIHTLPKFTTNTARVINRKELFEILSIQISIFELKSLMTQCHQMQVPIGQIKNMEEVFKSSTAQSMILTENQDGEETKRVSSIGFTIN